MKDEIIKKYVKDSDGLLEELNKLDAWALLEDDEELLIEFESRSKHFQKHIKKGDVKPERAHRESSKFTS